MTWSPDSSIAGRVVAYGGTTYQSSTGFDQSDDTSPAVNAKQKAVTAITSNTGTDGNTGKTNSPTYPFTATFFKPAVIKSLPAPNPVTGLRGAIPNNQYKLIVRKGGDVASGVPAVCVARLTIDVPAGMEAYSPLELRSLCSYLTGLLDEETSDLAQTLITGIL